MSNSVTSTITKNLMGQALKQLMMTKSLDKITVREIVDSCGLNRQTFYYHFQSIYDLLEWIFYQDVVMPLKERSAFSSWQDSARFLLTYIQENDTISLCILHSVGRDALRNFLRSDIIAIAREVIKPYAEGLPVDEKTMEHVVRYYTISLAAVLEDWVSRGMRESIDEVLDILDTILTGNVRAAFVRSCEKKQQKR